MEVYQAFKLDLCRLAVVMCVAAILWSYLPILRDDSDGGMLDGRSGMAVRIDHGTGLHYLEGSSGALIPRLDLDGQQMRERK